MRILFAAFALLGCSTTSTHDVTEIEGTAGADGLETSTEAVSTGGAGGTDSASTTSSSSATTGPVALFTAATSATATASSSSSSSGGAGSSSTTGQAATFNAVTNATFSAASSSTTGSDQTPDAPGCEAELCSPGHFDSAAYCYVDPVDFPVGQCFACPAGWNDCDGQGPEFVGWEGGETGCETPDSQLNELGQCGDCGPDTDKCECDVDGNCSGGW